MSVQQAIIQADRTSAVLLTPLCSQTVPPQYREGGGDMDGRKSLPLWKSSKLTHRKILPAVVKSKHREWSVQNYCPLNVNLYIKFSTSFIGKILIHQIMSSPAEKPNGFHQQYSCLSNLIHYQSKSTLSMLWVRAPGKHSLRAMEFQKTDAVKQGDLKHCIGFSILAFPSFKYLILWLQCSFIVLLLYACQCILFLRQSILSFIFYFHIFPIYTHEHYYLWCLFLHPWGWGFALLIPEFSCNSMILYK